MILRNTYRKVMRPANIRRDSYAQTDNSSITLHIKKYAIYFKNVTVTCIHTHFLNMNL